MRLRTNYLLVVSKALPAVVHFDTPQEPTLLAEIGSECVFRVGIFVGETQIGHGSSFVIHHSTTKDTSTTRLWLLTNLHVARGLIESYSYFRMALASGMPESLLGTLDASLKVQVRNEQIAVASVIAPRDEFFKRVFQPHLDFTILGADVPTEKLGRYFPFAPRGEIRVGMASFVLGFPADRDLSFAGGNIGHIYSSNSKTDTSEERADRRWAVQHDIETNGGNSGGPLISDSGKILGIHARGLKMFQGRTTEGLNTALNIADIYEFISDPGNLEEVSVVLLSERLKNRALEDFKYGG